MLKKPVLKKTRMAIKKKPTMRKAQDGDKIKRTEFNKDATLGDVSKRLNFKEMTSNFYKSDPAKADAAKTTTGKVLRKVANTVTKVAFTPHMLAMNAGRAIGHAIDNKKETSSLKKGGIVKKNKNGK